METINKVIIATDDGKGKKNIDVYSLPYLDENRVADIAVLIKTALNLSSRDFKLKNFRLDKLIDAELRSTTMKRRTIFSKANLISSSDADKFESAEREDTLSILSLSRIGENECGNISCGKIIVITIKENPFYIEEIEPRFKVTLRRASQVTLRCAGRIPLSESFRISSNNMQKIKSSSVDIFPELLKQ